MKNYSFTFNPRKKGLRQILGDLESDIMELIWDKEKLTVREVVDILNEKRSVAYTTVMTVMSRLAEKGILIKEKSGAAFVYKASLSKNDFTKSTVKKIMDSLMEDFTAPTVNQFLDYMEEDDPSKIDELAKIIEQKRKKKDV